MTEQCDHSGESSGRRPGARDSTGGNRIPDDEGFDLDDLFRVLADRRRRYALYRLRQTEGKVRLPALVRAVLKWENGTDAETVSEQRRQRTYLDFYHNHVPMLVDHGLASYDEDDGTVRLEADLGTASEHVRLARAHDDVPPADGDASPVDGGA